MKENVIFVIICGVSIVIIHFFLRDVFFKSDEPSVVDSVQPLSYFNQRFAELQQLLIGEPDEPPPPFSPQDSIPDLESNDTPAWESDNWFRDSLRDGSLGPKMVKIPAGDFQMGDIQGGGDDDEKPVHQVAVRAFAMGRYEVTVDEFRQFVNSTKYQTKAEKTGECWGFIGNNSGRNWRNPRFSQSENHPVVCVSWNDAVAYTMWLSQQTGKNYRLPTEAEWEYAARAGTKTKYWWGNIFRADSANCSGSTDSFEYTAPVGSFEPNPFGLSDTVGNVWEWVADKYHGNYEEAPTDGSAWRSGVSSERMLRGGSWVNDPNFCRSADRIWLNSNIRIIYFGFRVVIGRV
jgi:formylglycine-generating enzyme required for sulfatase activity